MLFKLPGQTGYGPSTVVQALKQQAVKPEPEIDLTGQLTNIIIKDGTNCIKGSASRVHWHCCHQNADVCAGDAEAYPTEVKLELEPGGIPPWLHAVQSQFYSNQHSKLLTALQPALCQCQVTLLSAVLHLFATVALQLLQWPQCSCVSSGNAL